MVREIKYLLYTSVILLFFVYTIYYYLSDQYEKEVYRGLNNHLKKITKYSENLIILKNDTNNIIEYIENNSGKSKKKYQFWKLIENDK